MTFWIGAGLSRLSGIDWDVPEDMRERYLRQPEQVRQLVSEWERRASECQPHAGHRLLARLQVENPGVRIITLNQDGLLQRAGCERVLEMHGRWGQWEGQRPAQVWMGDPYPMERIETALEWLRNCDVCVVVATSSRLQPLCDFPLEARKAGARLIEVNPEETPLSQHCHECHRGPLERLLSRWIKVPNGNH